MNKSGPAPTWQLGTKRRHITAATSESTRTNIPNHGDERRLRQTGQDTRGTRAESLLGDGARDLKRALYPARWNATCVPHDQSVGPVGLHGWEPPPGHSPQQVRNDAHADGRWEMGDGIRRWRRGAAISSSVGQLSTDSASVFRHFSTTTSNARDDGGCGGLVAGRSASGRDKGLSFAVAPSRLVTRCTSTRPSPRRKEQRSGQRSIGFASVWRAGVGIPFTWCLREFDGVMVPPPPIFGGPWAGLPAWVRRRTARGSSAVSCRRSSKMRDTVLGRDEIKPSPKLGDLFCLRVPVFLLLPLR